MRNARLLWLSFLVPLGLWAETPQSAPRLPSVEAGELNRFKDFQTDIDTISLSLDDLSLGKRSYHHLNLYLSSVANDTEEVRVSLHYRAPFPKNCRPVSLTVDGKKPALLGDPEYYSAEHHTDIGGYQSYSYVLTISWEEFSRFRNAKKIEGKFCGLGFALTKEERSAIKTYGELLASLKVSPTLPKVPAGRLTRGQEIKTGTKQLLLSLEKLSHQKKKYDQLHLLAKAYEAGATEVELSISYEPPESQDSCQEKSSLTADGKALTLLKDATYSSGTRATDMDDFEYYLARMLVSRDEFALLVKAKKIEGEYCGVSFMLTKEQKESLVIYEGALTL